MDTGFTSQMARSLSVETVLEEGFILGGVRLLNGYQRLGGSRSYTRTA